MKKYCPVFLLLLLFFVKSSHAEAATYYLSPSGNDANNGSEQSPWRTISKADTAITSGDTVILKNGQYSGYVSLDKPNTTWRAENKHQAIIDGGFSPTQLNGDWNNIVNVWNNACTNRGQWGALIDVAASGITVDGLFLRNSCGRGMLIADDVNNAVIQNNRIDWTFVSGFYVTGETNNLQVIGNEMTRISMNDMYATRVPCYCKNGQEKLQCLEDVANGVNVRPDYCVNISIHMSGENMVVRDNIIAWGRGEIAMTGSRNLLFEKNIVVGNKNNFYNGWAEGVVVRNNLFWAPDSVINPNTHWEKKGDNDNNWRISSRNENDDRWVNYASGINNAAYYNNLIINMSFDFHGYHRARGIFSTDTTRVYFGHNTLVAGSQAGEFFGTTFQSQVDGNLPKDSKITGIVENNIFDVSKNPDVNFPVNLSNNDQLTFRNNLMPATAPQKMKGTGDIYTSNPGLENSISNISFPIPAIGAASIDMTVLRNAVNINNYRLRATSPAINAGSTAGGTNDTQVPSLARSQDLQFANRTNNPDMGAFEYDGVAPSVPPSPSNPPVGWDLNSDGKINGYDFVKLVEGIGSSYTLSQVKTFLAEFL